MLRNNTIISIKNFQLKVLLFLFLFSFSKSWGQVLVTTTSYVQDFGTTDISTWTNNSTILGWYTSNSAFAHENIVTSPVPINNGSFYSYECNGDNNQKLGTRPSKFCSRSSRNIFKIWS